jgi:acyl-CoA synthetase (AMP-forming)/AMP-acid ligase II
LNLGGLLVLIDREEDGLPYLNEALDIAERSGAASVATLCHNYRGSALLQLGDLGGCDELLRSMARATELGNHEYVMRADWHALPDRAGDPRALAARQALLSPDDPISIQYTSGTTGHPKGATLSHHNILNNAHLIGEILGYTELDRVCVPVPLFHTFGMVIGNLGTTTHGACLVYPAPAFDPAATLAAVAEERCTSLYGVPAMFIAILAAPGFDAYDLSSLRTGAMGGSPCPAEVMKQVVDRMGMTEVTIVYGMTSGTSRSSECRTHDSVKRSWRGSGCGPAHGR